MTNLKTRVKSAKKIAKRIRKAGFSAQVVQRLKDDKEPVILIK